MLTIETNRIDYVGNGSAHVYNYTFKIFDDDDLLVKVRDLNGDETTLVKTTDYTVVGAGEASGTRTVNLVNAAQAWLTSGELKTGFALSIRRVLDLKQETDIRNQGDYFPEDIENQFDKQIMIDQQQQDEIDRSVKLPDTVPATDFDPTLPADISEASSALKVPVVNETADGFILMEASDIAGLAGQTSHTITEGQAATDLSGETVLAAAYTSAVYEYEIIRGTTVFTTGKFSLHYRNSTWYVVVWSSNMDDLAVADGVTFSVTGTTTAQLKAAVATDGAGNGTIKLKKHRFGV